MNCMILNSLPMSCLCNHFTPESDCEDIDDGDVAQAIADLKEIYESLIDRVEGDAR